MPDRHAAIVSSLVALSILGECGRPGPEAVSHRGARPAPEVEAAATQGTDGTRAADAAVRRTLANVPAQDSTVEAARTLEITVPVMCREWHIWWGSPHGVRPKLPRWNHWNGLRRFGRHDAATLIEETVAGLAWRRYLNCVGYPLLGPYDPAQPDIIRWQLETARNAGIECLHVQLWPSIWDAGTDFTPTPIFERVLEAGAALGYPVGVHDEIQFRRPNITGAQKLENAITRASTLLTRYGRHPGWYKIDGTPIYYFQNWSGWISAKDMATFFAEVEKTAGPVYWMIEMGPNEEYVKIPELKCYFGPHCGWFNHIDLVEEKRSLEHYRWDELRKNSRAAAALARKHGKKYGALVYTRFDNRNDRGSPSSACYIPAEDGMFYVRALEGAVETSPDFIVVTQWNDFEECAFIEPAWDFDGFNGDPYRYCRITAAAVGRDFVPARLPRREELDPFIRNKLFGDTRPGDMGPVFHGASLAERRLSWRWAKGSGDPVEFRIIQDSLLCWRPSAPPFGGIRLGNPTADDGECTLTAKTQLRFYVPDGVRDGPGTAWLGVRASCPAGTSVQVQYRSVMENYRVDSRWERRHVTVTSGARIVLEDGSHMYWNPLHGVRFTGYEGDLLVSLGGKKEASVLREMVLWLPDMEGAAEAVSWARESVRLPPEIRPSASMVVVAYDATGNAGLPRLFCEGRTTPTSDRYPMDLVRPSPE